MLQEITDADFKKQVINADQPVLVDFYASWCQPCKKLMPQVEKLAKKYNTKIKFYKMSVEKNSQTPRMFGIMGIPNILIFNNKKIIEQFVGDVTKEKIEAKLKEL